MIASPPSSVLLIPLQNQVAFPGIKTSLTLKQDVFDQVVAYCEQAKTRLIGVVAQRPASGATDDVEGQADELYEIGTYGELTGQKLVEDVVHVSFEGKARFRVLEYMQTAPFRLANIQVLQEQERPESEESQSLVSQVQEALQQMLEVSVLDSPPPQIQYPDRAGMLADMVGAGMGKGTIAERQRVLEELDVPKRLALVLDMLTHVIETARVSREINSQMQKRTEDEIKENIIRRQIGELQQELRKVRNLKAEAEEEEARGGAPAEPDEYDTLAAEDEEDDVANMKEALMKANMPPEARRIAQRELKRLQNIEPQHPEYLVARTYLDLLANLPWDTSSVDSDDLVEARSVLDRDHYGLEKVKKRILEFLAVTKLRKGMKGPILCLHGPPGVGKTSLGRSIAKSLGRKFFRVALGGVRDESELRGHRRTYVGAMPGVIIEALRSTETRNPVILLDEIDKLTNNSQGNPSAALLEILDPEQNHTFKDHYVNTSFDLSNVLFLATCNEAGMIDRALYDRMEVIDLGGYTVEEKFHIATGHLLPKQRREHALEKDDDHPEEADGDDSETGRTREEVSKPLPAGPTQPLLEIAPEAMTDLIQKWTQESGVRSLERQLGRVCRFAALRIAEAISGESLSPEASDGLSPTEETQTEKEAAEALADCGPREDGRVFVEARHLPYIIGMPIVEPEIAERLTVGMAMGLAVSGAGGSLMFVESTKLRGNGGLMVTGQLGKVMVESVRIALSLLQSKVQKAIEKQGGFRDQGPEGLGGAHLPYSGGPATPPPASFRQGSAHRPELLRLTAAAPGRSGTPVSEAAGAQQREEDKGGEQEKVMKALTASQLKSNAPELFGYADLHVHFPAGGIPKDGPSAGVAVTLALASLFLGRPVRSDTAVTGEITLRGHVLPVGGIKDKVLAAHRAGLRHVLLPEDNRKHVKEEVTDSILKELEVHYVKHIDEALDWAFAEELGELPLLAAPSNAGGIARASSRPLKAGL